MKKVKTSSDRSVNVGIQNSQEHVITRSYGLSGALQSQAYISSKSAKTSCILNSTNSRTCRARKGGTEVICKHWSLPIHPKLSVNCSILPEQFATNRPRRLRKSRIKKKVIEFSQTVFKFLRSNVFSQGVYAQMSRRGSILPNSRAFKMGISAKMSWYHGIL